MKPASISRRVAPLKAYAVARGVAYGTARDACMRGEYEFLRIGRALYVEIATFEKWLDSKRENAA